MKLDLETPEGLADALHKLCAHYQSVGDWVAWLNLRIAMREKGFL